MPALEEVLGVLRGSATGLLLELKHPGRYPGMVADVAAMIDPSDQVVVQSFDHAAMLRSSSARRTCRWGCSGPTAAAAVPGRQLGRPGQPAAPDPHRPVRRGGARGRAAMPDLAVDDVADMRRMVGLGVDGIITNRPERLAGVLGRLTPAV